MNSVIQDVALLFIPSALYYMIWRWVNKKNFSELILLIVSFVTLFSFGFYAIDRDSYSEISSIGNGFLYTSPIIILAPILFFFREKLINLNNGTLSIIVFPVLGVGVIFFLLILTNQISGM